MTHLLMYAHPTRTFQKPQAGYARVQVRIAERFRIKPECALFATNFPWEYRGYRTTVLDFDPCFEIARRRMGGFGRAGLRGEVKQFTILTLMQAGLLQGKWFYRDTDAFPVLPIDYPQDSDKPLLLSCYSRKPTNFQSGVIFGDGIRGMPAINQLYAYLRDCSASGSDEEAGEILFRQGTGPWQSDTFRYLDASYNLGNKNIEKSLRHCRGPVKIIHTHPGRDYEGGKLIDYFYGKNKIGASVAPEWLREIMREECVC